MEKLNLITKDLAQENITKLAKLFPEIVTEVEKNGSIIKTINLDKLKNLVGDFAEDSDEVYELSWVGKHKSRQKIVMPINKTLRPVPEESVDFENTENLYIEGDNFEVLKLLQESYLNKIKMIYIDPPYNTGKDFVYKDNFSQSREEYDEESGALDEDGNKLFKNTITNGRFHSDWLSMLFKRLVIAKDLLRDDGVIFISIDDNEVDNLRKVCDEVFGESNFIGNIVWRSKSGGANDSKHIAVDHEYILVFAKDINECKIGRTEYTDELFKLYNSKDENFEENGPYRPMLLMQKGLSYSESLTYPIEAPDGTILTPDKGGAIWRWSEARFKQKLKEGYVEFKKSANGWKIYTKQYLKVDYDGNKIERGKLLRSVITDYDGRDGTRDIQNLFKNKCFTNPKSVKLMSLFSQIGLNDDNVCLDFFSGSATTAHAVMQLNAEDGGSRKFIMVQLPEPTSEDSEAFTAGYKNISEFGKERIRRAAKKIKEDNEDKDLSNVDLGFRVFKVDSSNMKDVYYNPNEIDQRTLTNLKDNIKEDRTEEDLLFQVLLELAISISAKITEEKANNKTIYKVNDNFLLACFDDDVDLETIRIIAELDPLRIVFKDSSFKDDATKVNCDEYLKNKLPNTIVKVI